MKFIHIADVHLGLVTDPGCSWSRQWTEDRMATFRSVLDVCNQDQIDLLLISGDLFHQIPTVAELKEVDYLFSTLTHTYVVLIAGNHDPNTPDSPYQDFTWCKQVIFLRKPTFASAYFPHLDTEVCGFSYDRIEIPEARCQNVRPGTKGRHQILLLHGGDASHVPFRVRDLHSKGFDYIALGHIHQPSQWPEQCAAYAGSLEPTDQNDTGARGYIRGEITDEGTTFSFVPASRHEYRQLRLNLTPEITQTAVEDQLRRLLAERMNCVFRILLEGSTDPVAPIDPDRLKLLGHIIRVEDHTTPAYDLAILRREHAGDVIGHFLASFPEEGLSPVESKALYYGLSALLKGESK